MYEPTASVCPICLRHIPAYRTEREDGVYLIKECPAHGSFDTLIWRNAAHYRAWGNGSLHALELDANCEKDAPCIDGCGLCGSHEGDTCIAVVNLTNRCNLACPVCFAQANEHASTKRFRRSEGLSSGRIDTTHRRDAANEPDIEDIACMFKAIAAKPTVPTVQLSGGEPTMRNDLADIVRLAKESGIAHLLLNTNGIRLAEKPLLARQLAEAGLDTVYLQFDGLRVEDYLTLRGIDLLEEKLGALEACKASGLGVVLVPTVYPGVNDDALGDIVEFAKDWMPTVKGIHFQPVSYFGRTLTHAPLGPGRITLPDIISNLERQTNGEVSAQAMLPRRKFDAHCSFSSVFLLSSRGKLVPITHTNDQTGGHPDDFEFDIFAREAIEFANKYWRADLAKAVQGCCGMPDKPIAQTILDRTLTISGMHFQDAFNIDLERLRGCCVHVVKPDGRFVPLCAEYLTAADSTPYHALRNATGSQRNRL